MCGIFGLAVKSTNNMNINIHDLMNYLYLKSETRGKEASGLLMNISGDIWIDKCGESGKAYIKRQEYNNCINQVNFNKTDKSVILIGHSRLVTNGNGALNQNNQPVYRDNIGLVHNGIIVNESQIWNFIGQSPTTDVDSEVIAALLADKISMGGSLLEAANTSLKSLNGSASIACTQKGGSDLLLFTNTGSLYLASINDNLTIFASEKFILNKLINKFFNPESKTVLIEKLELNSAKLISLGNKLKSIDNNYFTNLSKPDYPDFDKLKRCTKCILPSTFPYIKFNSDGICNYCINYKKIKLKPLSELKEKISSHKNSIDQNCIVGISGGRDSCYGAHIIKNNLGLNPISFTYDWGLVTDEARKNIAKICGKLGIENIIVSADIAKKRRNVRKNIEAWLAKPSLKMIPIFMAGDKLFYYYAHKIRKQTNIPLFIFCAGNKLETTDFKVGFNGIEGGGNTGILTSLSLKSKIKLICSYLSEIIKNPRYLNSSILDSIKGFYCSYFLKDDYIYLYDYYPWNEDEINKVIKDEYDWVGASDTTSTWRTGDGSSSFYNYIYYVVAGFTEHDTFRSNQIREGIITREEAINLVKNENKPRWISLQEYANVIGFNLNESLNVIHRMEKLY